MSSGSAPQMLDMLMMRTRVPAQVHKCHSICDFFGSFGFMVQGVLAVLSFTALIIKRYQETPRRPVNVFKFDAAKNGIGAGLAHFINIFISVIFAGKTDPCPFYLVQILTDTTLIVWLNFIILRKVEQHIQLEWGLNVASGDYGEPPNWRRWLQQVGVWCGVVVGCKLAAACVQWIFVVPLGQMGTIILSPLCFNPHLELFIVLVLLPLLLNAFQFWIVDNYLMSAPDSYKKELPSFPGMYGSFPSVEQR
ncbi:vacuolar membrane protein-domain-containing protein [Baffinella frigidus]|nr:vacuolar membrane protein-domain-containing protein [Cryptophyta sp. CCMP2293]